MRAACPIRHASLAMIVRLFTAEQNKPKQNRKTHRDDEGEVDADGEVGDGHHVAAHQLHKLHGLDKPEHARFSPAEGYQFRKHHLGQLVDQPAVYDRRRGKRREGKSGGTGASKRVDFSWPEMYVLSAPGTEDGQHFEFVVVVTVDDSRISEVWYSDLWATNLQGETQVAPVVLWFPR